MPARRNSFSRERLPLPRRRLMIAALLVFAGAMAIASARMIIGNTDPSWRARVALSRREYESVLRELEKASGPDALACRLAFRLAWIGAGVQLTREYEAMWDNVSPIGDARRLLLERRDRWLMAMVTGMQDLQNDAAQFRQVYRRGQVLSTPWRGALRIGVREDQVLTAINSLRGGDVEERYFTTLEKGLTEFAVLATLQAVLGQPEGHRVLLRHQFDLPALLFHVGAKVNDVDLARWYMNEVMALTAEKPDHPLRQYAGRFLDEPAAPQ